MKRIILFSVIILLLNTNGKAQVSDTAQYLLDSIQPKINYYVGKPLKTLLSDLKINIVSYEGIFPIWRQPDTIHFRGTCLNFHSIDEILKRNDWGIKSPGIYIKFAQPIPIPKAWFMHGGRFEKDVWDLQKERFFRNFIVGEIELRGI